MKTLIASLALVLGLSVAGCALAAEKPCLTTAWVDAHDPSLRMISVKQDISAPDGKTTGQVRIYQDGSALVSYFDGKGCMMFATRLSRSDAEFLISKFGGQAL
jgi:hypothetical protein